MDLDAVIDRLVARVNGRPAVPATAEEVPLSLLLRETEPGDVTLHASHRLQLEHPRAFASLVAAFLHGET